MKKLLIVESPAKARTIKKYLGTDFQIMASVGHLKDLPVRRLGVDIEKNFRPEYVTIKGKSKILKELKSAAKKAEIIYLGPDPDREGEAIAWHIAEELNGGGRQIYRVLFNELTAKAIREAVASPRDLDRHRFESQQARRILDRLVGYQISPLLWSKVKRGLSAGRVQSVALRMICEREREIYAFEPEEYWSLTAHLEADEPPVFKAKFIRYDGRKRALKTEGETLQMMAEAQGKPFTVAKVTRKKKRRNPPPPFITSLLQQEAYKRLGFSAKKTMSVAQMLYEGISLGDAGNTGLITYMRTDSYRIAEDAVDQVRGYIGQNYGDRFLPSRPNRFKSPKQAQEAHEAIRPTSVDLEPERIARFLSKDQLSLYTLIWKRFVACQMAPAVLEQTQAEITAGKTVFSASGSVMVFKGFTAVMESEPAAAEGGPEAVRLPPLKKGQALRLLKLDPAQHYTQPPPRYSEATLIKALEENGIGRPSTYAAILANISDRQYVTTEKRRFRPTELGFLVTDLLVRGFPDIMDYAFTAQMENDLDRVERGQLNWLNLLKRFYKGFAQSLEKAHKEMKGEVPTDLACPECGRPLAVKSGKNGLFLGCTGYPECRHTSNFHRDEKGRIVPDSPQAPQETGISCERCGKPMLIRQGRFGPFLACSGYPECKVTRPVEEPAGSAAGDVTCRLCGARMQVKVNRSGQRFLSCERFPDCRHSEPLKTGVACPQEGCGGTLVERVSKRGRKFYACDRYPECRFAMWDEPVDETCPQCGTTVLALKRRSGGQVEAVCRRRGCGHRQPAALETREGEDASAPGSG